MDDDVDNDHDTDYIHSHQEKKIGIKKKMKKFNVESLS